MTLDVFRAVADPTRREIIGLLAHNELRLSDISGYFDMTRPAVAKHLKILVDTGIVRQRVQGRETLSRLEAAPLKQMSDWVSRFEHFWEPRLDALKTIVDADFEQEPKS
ncbi:MAG: metalloregulator ArsR/SmtB family transcription factor [Pseudomonadota bacterium]